MWHVAIDGQQQGVMSEDEVRRMVASGRLKPTDLIWREGMAEWLPASQALPDAFASPTMPAPPTPVAPAMGQYGAGLPMPPPPGSPAYGAMTTGPIGAAPGGGCPFCGGALEKPGEYAHLTVCKKCRSSLSNRRALAFLIDAVALMFLICMLGFVIGVVGAIMGANDSAETLATVLGYVFWISGLLVKDSFRGQSLGKKLTGVRVVDVTTGEPGGLKVSVMRNLPLFLPFGPIIAASQMSNRGKRYGEGWTNSMVVRV